MVGEIVGINDVDNSIVIEDSTGKNWQIDEKTIKLPSKNVPKKGKIVKIVGKKSGEHTFVANEIRKCGNCQGDDDNDEDDKNITQNVNNEFIDDDGDAVKIQN